MIHLLPLIISLPLLAFWLWMFWDMVNNESLPANTRPLWLLGFIFLSFLTAGYYYFTEYTKDV